ncbi:MAG: AMP-binding protein, partial [Luminiphilus sp.]
VRVGPDHGLDLEAVINHCRQQLAGFKVPAHLQFTEEALPRNALKKLIKTDILARYFPND